MRNRAHRSRLLSPRMIKNRELSLENSLPSPSAPPACQCFTPLSRKIDDVCLSSRRSRPVDSHRFRSSYNRP